MRKRQSPWRGTEADPPSEAAHSDGPARTDVGALLRDRRVELGLELRDVVGSTRIRRVHLAAIEDGHFDQLPGHTYVVGFLRNYSLFLGLDPDEVIRRYRSGSAGGPPEPAYNPPKPIPEGGVPTGAIVLIALLLGAAGYGGWYFMSVTDRSISDLTGPLPNRLQEMIAGWGGGSGVSHDIALAAVNPSATIAPAPIVPGMPVHNGPAAPASVADIRIPPAAALPVSPSSSALVQPAPTGAAASAPPPSPPTPPVPTTVLPSASAAVSVTPVLVPPATAAPAPLRTPPPASPTTAAIVPAPVPPAPVPPAPVLASRPGAAPAVPPRPVPADDDGEGEVAPVTVELIGNRTATAAPDGALPRAPEIAAATQVAIATPAVDPNRVFGATTGPARVVLRATADSWVQVRDGTGELIFTRVLRPGEVYRVPDRPGLRMVTGNAGGLSISVDDRNLAPIGTPGQVMRDVPLDASRLLAQPGPAAN
jgi:cytoskeleton protein RodZ